MIYILIAVLLLVGIIRYDFKGKASERYYWVVCAVMIMVEGLSYRIGSDTPSYMYNFNLYPKINALSLQYILDSVMEPLWIILNSLCKSIVNDYAFLHTIIAIIFNGSVFYFFKDTKFPYTAILLLFLICWFNWAFEAIRESLSFSFFLIGMKKLMDGKPVWKYYLWVIPSLLLHRFAFLIVLSPPLFKILKTNISAILSLVVLLIIFLFFLQNINGLFILNDLYEAKLGYVSNYEGFGLSINLVLTCVVLPTILAIICNKKDKFMFSMMIMTIFYGILRTALPATERVYMYCVPLIIVVAIENLSLRGHINFKKLLAMGLLTIFVVGKTFFIVHPYEGDSNSKVNCFYFPYYSIITHNTDPNREAHIYEQRGL